MAISTSDAIKVASNVEDICRAHPAWRLGWQIWENHNLSRIAKSDHWCAQFETYARGDVVTVFALHECWIDDIDVYRAVERTLREAFPDRIIDTLDHVFRIHCPYAEVAA